jgi:hypothetical protein
MEVDAPPPEPQPKFGVLEASSEAYFVITAAFQKCGPRYGAVLPGPRVIRPFKMLITLKPLVVLI